MAYGRRKFWLHQCQPTIPRDSIPKNHRLVGLDELARIMCRSRSNVYWLMRGRRLYGLGVVRYFKHGGRWWFLINDDYFSRQRA